MYHGIYIIDEEPGKDGMLIPDIESFKGAVLANHRSWGDFVVDPYQGHSAVIGRFAAFVAMGFAGLLAVLSDRAIIIRRGKTTRKMLQAKCARYPRYLIYPEGTRRASEPNADQPIPLKGVGGLKNIWEAQVPALIVITVNKENILNERNGRVSFSTTLFRTREGPIHASDYADDFDAFRNAVQAAWERCWTRAYALRASMELHGRLPSHPTVRGRLAPQTDNSTGSTDAAEIVAKLRVSPEEDRKPVVDEPVVLKAWPSIRNRSEQAGAQADAGRGTVSAPCS
mmetsp:Transcript_8982/g.25078  ORF Transcript_8982/g.25078 Transcript_8982/m.25078 type:complete len:284 (-) Transcript_8982:647-1498(-)